MLYGVTKQGGVKLLDSLQGEKMVSELGITRGVESIAIFATRKKKENEKVLTINKQTTGSFHCGAAETNLTSIHEDAGLIPDLAR